MQKGAAVAAVPLRTRCIALVLSSLWGVYHADNMAYPAILPTQVF